MLKIGSFEWGNYTIKKLSVVVPIEWVPVRWMWYAKIYLENSPSVLLLWESETLFKFFSLIWKTNKLKIHSRFWEINYAKSIKIFIEWMPSLCSIRYRTDLISSVVFFHFLHTNQKLMSLHAIYQLILFDIFTRWLFGKYSENKCKYCTHYIA